MDTNTLIRRVLLSSLLGAAALFAGCQILPEATPDPTRYYVLNGLAPVTSGLVNVEGRLQVGLRPVDVPEYLRKTRSLVVREGTNQVRIQDDARWAETLDGGINRVLRDRLLSSPRVAGVYTHPFPGAVRRDCDISIRLLRCEGSVNEKGETVARFAATYEITAGMASGQVVARRTFYSPDAPWDGRDFGVLARLLSDAAQQLSDAIANDLPQGN